MVGCKRTRKLIDEADKPDLLPFEASSHVESCPGCEAFAAERARLRSLLVSGPRVSVPMNFDAVLKSRLADAKSRRSFAWLSPAGYLRLGGATAALAVVVFAAQYGGLFNRAPESESRIATRQDQPTRVPQSAAVGVKPIDVVPAAAASAPGRPARRGNAYSSRVAAAGVRVDLPREDYLHEDGGVMLVRGSDGEGEMSLPMVSVGAQSVVYASAGATRRPTRAIGTSF